MIEQFTPTPSDEINVLHQVQHKLSDWFSWQIENELDYSHLASDGVNPDVINQLLNHGFIKREVSWIIPPRTLSHRIKNNELLTRDEGAKAIRAARICAIAETVFGNGEKAQRWLSKPKKSLNGLTPKDAIQDEFGASQVEKLLMAIDEGYF
jgi:putative toxin-antitoxin system antitoxin component (TIGR02293 family)